MRNFFILTLLGREKNPARVNYLSTRVEKRLRKELLALPTSC